MSAVDDVCAERAAQDRKWGGADHDDEHDETDWEDYIRDHLKRASQAVDRRRQP